MNCEVTVKVDKKVLSTICVVFLTFFCTLGFSSNSVFAAATQSTISMSIQSGSLSVNLMPAAGGTFGESGNATLSVTTDNYTGYKLSLSMGDGTSLLNENDDEITSISSAISNQTFSTSSTYNNKWGIKPNQYILSSGGTDTVVNNTDFLPAPSEQGLVIDKTSAANSIANTYTFSFGARVDTTLPAGTYANTYVLTAVANSIVFNVTYDDNTTDTVTNMPTPNPQPTTIDGGTPAEDSYVTLSDVTPVRNDKKFAGWCDVATGTDATSGDDTCSGTLYKAGDELPVDQTAGPNITLYAVWVDTLFPVVWNQMGACEFHGATNGNITGSACTDYHDVKFIDTGVALYSQANYLKDFEIHFTLDHYLPSEQVNYFGSEDNGQQTFVNDKLGSHAADGKAPGVTVRRATSNIDFNSKFGDEQEKKEIPYAQVHDVSMFRLDNKIYYSYDGGPLVFLQDITGFNQQFDLTTWFGAYPRDDCDGSQGPCTSAKRIPEATMSNMYIRLGEYSDEDVHTINFKANDGTTTTVATYLIKDGNAVTTIPTAPVYVDHYFQGWFTAQSGGTEVTTSTIPDASADYYAHWLGSVAVADIDNPVFSLEPNETETIVVNNASELEPYSFSSSNDNVATVNSTTGEITAVGPGTATITMTGATSGATQTISVTVAGQVIHVSFDSQGGTPASYSWDVGNGSSFSTLPAPTKEDHEFAGWWTGTNGTGTELTTSTVFDENTPTQYYANWTEMVYVCRIATSLHTETCSKSNGNGCRKAGWASNASNTIIEYGHLVSKAEETHGAAYDCDVDYDGTYDSENERFYYFGTENGNAKFIHYKNMPDNSTDELNPSVAYNAAIALLPNYELDQQNPLVPVWDNPHLVTHTSGAYAGKAARFMTYPEITGGLWSGGNNHITPSDPVSTYLFEQSNFATNNATDGIWLEEQPSFKNRIQTNALTLTHGSTSANAARATIDVPVEYVQPYVEAETYDITFDPHNETNSWTETIDAGDDLSDVYPATDPSYTNHLFQGWFTAATGGSQISSSTEPSGNTTYHAQWLKTVALAELVSNSISIEASQSATISVTNSGELEPYTFTSNDTGIATVNSPTGEVTGVANGTTTITMTGTTSGATKTINVVVSDLLPVTQAVIANSDLTVPVGGNITIQVSNSASLEPYTFSSDDTSIATVDSSTGVVTGVGVGTVDIIMTGTNSGLTKTLEVDVLSSLQDFTVTFNANGGTLDDGASSTRTVTDGDEVGALPTASKTNHKFFGWYKDDGTFYEEVYADEVIEDNVTYYAKWVEDTSSLPIVWSEINACQFNGNAVISGDYCTQNKTKKMVDTGVSLFNTTNYQKDFEIGFTVVEYTTSSQSETQATLVNSKYENSGVNYPGFVLRRNGTNFQLTSKWSSGAPTDASTTAASLKTVKIVRQNGVLKYSFNGGNLTTYFDTSGNTHRFDTRVWFGAAATSDNETPQRYLKGTLTDMYVRMGVQNTYNVELNPNGGTLPSGTQTNFTITAGDPVGVLPTPTAPSASYTFGGWYNGSTLVSDGTQYIPTSDVTLVAKWVYNSSDTPVVFNIANDALQGYQTLINGWVPSPINIATFNEASPINNSTWGDTSELNEQEFWEGIKDNFEDNSCSIPSYSDATKPLSSLSNWVNGSYDCSKPRAYDTKIGAALNVYLNDENGAQVAYANAADGVIHNMIPGQTYYWEKADDSTVYGYVTATSVNGRRPIELSANRNTRDLGGLPVSYTDSNNQTVTGTTAYGRLFRGERLWSTPATELYNLGINKQYDVGDPSEYANDTKLSDYQWDPVVHYNFDYNSGDENNASSNYMKAWTAVTDIMTDITSANDPKNIYFHCRVGADRTGTTAYLLEGLLGVPDEARYEEYELTNLSGLYDRTRYYKQKSSTNNLKFVFMMEYVKTNADILNWYMSNPNSDMNLVQAFRSAMTVTGGNGGGSGQQGANNAPANTNSVSPLSMQMMAGSNTSDQTDDGSETNSNSNTSDSSYSAPLGVTQTTESTATTETSNSFDAGQLALATVGVAAAGAVAYAAIRHNQQKES